MKKIGSGPLLSASPPASSAPPPKPPPQVFNRRSLKMQPPLLTDCSVGGLTLQLRYSSAVMDGITQSTGLSLLLNPSVKLRWLGTAEPLCSVPAARDLAPLTPRLKPACKLPPPTCQHGQAEREHKAVLAHLLSQTP